MPSEIKDLIEPGYDLIDPAVLSTSIRNDVTVGGGDKLRIFIPKGARIIPIMGDMSHHSSEQEIILPPLSIIKILESQRKNNRWFIQGIFMGSAHNSMLETLKNMGKNVQEVRLRRFKDMILMDEAKNNKDPKYDAEGKFGGAYDWQTAESLKRMIKSGKLKVEKIQDTTKKKR